MYTFLPPTPDRFNDCNIQCYYSFFNQSRELEVLIDQ